MKTNKSYTKRLKVTRTGKVIARVSGQNHFNAKDSGQKRLHKQRTSELHISNKSRNRFIPHN